MLHDILTFLAPYLPGLIDTAVAAVVGWLALLLTRYTGVTIDARHREALQSALRNGAMIALSRGMVGPPAATIVRGYVEASVPEALRHFKPDPGVLDNLIRAKLAEAGVPHLTVPHIPSSPR